MSSQSYAIAAGNQATLDAAKDILQAGGNAVDAAIAAFWASMVAEPCMSSIGAGGFAQVAMGSEQKVVDFFCQTPKHKMSPEQQDFFPITVDFGNTTEDFHVGNGAAATPGAVAGIFEMHKRWGTLPMQELAQHAIHYAKSGVRVDSFQAYDMSLLKDIIGLSEDGKRILYKDGDILKEDDTIFMPQFADFLDVLVREGSDLVYKGEIARRIVADCEHNGSLSYEDFSDYKVRIVDPLRSELKDYSIFTTGYPSAGGALIAAYLHEFEKQTDDSLPTFGSMEFFNIHRKVYEKINTLKDNTARLSHYLQETMGIRYPELDAQAKWSGTSHFNIADKDGNCVSLSMSIGEGNGYFIPGTDMHMNNMLGESALLPDGFHSWTQDTRLRSMMTPTIVRDNDGDVRLITGSGGAGRIPFAIAQTIINHIVYDMYAADAVNAPRIYNDGATIQIEKGIQAQGPNINIWDEPSLYFGGVHTIIKKGSSLDASGDQRRCGVAFVKE